MYDLLFCRLLSVQAPTQQTNREVMVGPDHFPQHLPIEDVTPDKVKDALATTSESGVGDSEAAELVAESVAADFNWTIEVLQHIVVDSN